MNQSRPQGSLTLDISGLTIAISVPDRAWLPGLRERYHEFLSDAPSRWQVDLRHDPALIDTEHPWLRHHGRLSVFRVNAYSGWFDMARRYATVTTPSHARALSALERTLAYVCMQALPREYDALLLHSVGVEVNGLGHVFFGPSGAGKTTVARLSEGHGRVLSDESVILRNTNQGVMLDSTPFWGLSTPPAMIHRARKTVPLVALYALSHAPDFRLVRIRPWEAVSALLDTEKVAIERVESASAWLSVAERLLAGVPVYRLSFPPTPDLWPFLISSSSAAPRGQVT
jgi:hypothetical protein